MITREEFEEGKYYLVCYVNSDGEETREVETYHDFEELEESVGYIEAELAEEGTLEVLDLNEAYDNGIGFPDEDNYNRETGEFTE